MDFMYLGILCFLLILAVFDLSVGVANDAVNFLSPAVGAKAAKFKLILAVAAIGIFIGASTSNGMMDIARHGILKPEYYSFADVICVFLAVSATDVILLDFFNTLGMPTSTTVSMVFGLMGGTTALALLNMGDLGKPYHELINTDKALSVILGIFLSVAIAFIVGTVVMWIARIIFTFNYKKNLRWTIGIFGGCSIAFIFYFLLTKGFGQSPLLEGTAFKHYTDTHPWQILLYSIVISTLLVQLLHWLKINVFKVIILFGTFSLAMAFAGNDLVNFIGVPLAGLEGFLQYTYHNPQSLSADTFMMTALAGKSTLPGVSYFLIAAGFVMIIAIWTSKKAQQVVQTTVKLSSQTENEEVFSSSKLARSLVRGVLNMNQSVTRFVPQRLQQWVNGRFDLEKSDADEGVAFDLVRGSVNLVLAGLLITIGTSLSLPLSTTYVAFMIAMGSSLADRAWGRETAVYRITNVISVIGGWFITAGAAFILAFLIAMFNHVGGYFAMIAMIAIIALVLVNNNRRFKKKQAESEQVDTLFREMANSRDKQEVWSLLRRHVSRTHEHALTTIRQAVTLLTEGFVADDVRTIREASTQTNQEREMWKRYRRKEIMGMRRIDTLLAVEKNTWFHLGANSVSQMLYSMKRAIEPVLEHVDNNFTPLPSDYAEGLRKVAAGTEDYLLAVAQVIEANDYSRSTELVAQGSTFKSEISAVRHDLQNRIQREDANLKIALLYLNTLQEMQEIISHARHLLRAARRFAE